MRDSLEKYKNAQRCLKAFETKNVRYGRVLLMALCCFEIQDDFARKWNFFADIKKIRWDVELINLPETSEGCSVASNQCQKLVWGNILNHNKIVNTSLLNLLINNSAEDCTQPNRICLNMWTSLSCFFTPLRTAAYQTAFPGHCKRWWKIWSAIFLRQKVIFRSRLSCFLCPNFSFAAFHLSPLLTPLIFRIFLFFIRSD